MGLIVQSLQYKVIQNTGGHSTDNIQPIIGIQRKLEKVTHTGLHPINRIIHTDKKKIDKQEKEKKEKEKKNHVK